MRIPRRQTIGISGIFHKMWRAHNREPVLESNTEKAAYLESLTRTLNDRISPYVSWHSFCFMRTHPHETGRLHFEQGRESCFKALGNWMRNAHSRFGQGYNRRHHRQGKVAYDRPKTKEIDANGGLLEVMFYSDANPVKAGIVSHPSHYRYSSYRYYAYGEKNHLTAALVPPPEYLALGESPTARQKRYRQLCDAYLRTEKLISDKPPKFPDTTMKPLQSEKTSKQTQSESKIIDSS